VDIRTPRISAPEYAGHSTGPYSRRPSSVRRTVRRFPAESGRCRSPRRSCGSDRTIRPVKLWEVIAWSSISDRISSPVAVREYRVRVSSPRASGRISTGTPIGIEYLSDADPSIVRPWLYRTLTCARPRRERETSARTLLNAAGSIVSM